MSSSRVASATSLAPQARKNSVDPPNVPVPKLKAGTFNPDRPNVRNSMRSRCVGNPNDAVGTPRKTPRLTLWNSVSPVLKVLTFLKPQKKAAHKGRLPNPKNFLRHNPRRRLRCRPRSSSGRRFIQNPVMDRKQCQLQPVRNADLVIHIAQIILDDLLGRPQLRGNFFVLVALHNQRH